MELRRPRHRRPISKSYSDTDLLPATRKVQEKGKTVEYIGFSHPLILALIARCNKSRLLDKADLEGLIPSKQG